MIEEEEPRAAGFTARLGEREWIKRGDFALSFPFLEGGGREEGNSREAREETGIEERRIEGEEERELGRGTGGGENSGEARGGPIGEVGWWKGEAVQGEPAEAEQVGAG